MQCCIFIITFFHLAFCVHFFPKSYTNKFIFFRIQDWLFISNEMKGKLYFPKLIFNDAKSIAIEKFYGTRKSQHYWMVKNYENYDFEYYERIRITTYC